VRLLRTAADTAASTVKQTIKDRTLAAAGVLMTVELLLARDRAESFHQRFAFLAIVDHECVVFAMC
jgi:hypothetical protein